MTTCYIGLGSNLDSPPHQLQQAIATLRKLSCCRLLATSPFYGSKAIGPGEQPDYCNAVVKISTEMRPSTLLDQLQDIERNQGRVRTIRWGPRTLDLDILLFGERHMTSARLTLPHPRLTERNFVIYPLFDLEPDLILPGGPALRTVVTQTSCRGIWRIRKQTAQPEHGEHQDHKEALCRE